MVKYYKLEMIKEDTQENVIRIVILMSNDLFLDKFLINNGLIVRNKTEVSAQTYILTAKDKKLIVATGKEKFK